MGDDAAYRDQRKTERISAHLKVLFRPLPEAVAEGLVGVDQLPPLPEAIAAQPMVEGKTENLSQGGLSLTGSMEGLLGGHLLKGAKLWLEFELEDGSPTVRSMAVVAWCIEGSGATAKFTAGLMFLGISSADLDRIGAWVHARHEGG